MGIEAIRLALSIDAEPIHDPQSFHDHPIPDTYDGNAYLNVGDYCPLHRNTAFTVFINDIYNVFRREFTVCANHLQIQTLMQTLRFHLGSETAEHIEDLYCCFIYKVAERFRLNSSPVLELAMDPNPPYLEYGDVTLDPKLDYVVHVTCHGISFCQCNCGLFSEHSLSGSQ
jgi:hypothetical protein